MLDQDPGPGDFFDTNADTRSVCGIAANLLVNRHPICAVLARRSTSVVRRANTVRECNDRSLTGSPMQTFTRIIRPTLIHGRTELPLIIGSGVL